MNDFERLNEKREDQQIFKRLWGYLKQYKKKFFLALALMIMGVTLGLFLPVGGGELIDFMESALPYDERFKILVIGAILFVTLIILRALITFYNQTILQRIGITITTNIQKEVYEHIINLSTGQINKIPVGKLVTRVSNDPNSLAEMFANVIVSLISQVFQMIVVLIILFIINWQMTLIILIMLPVMLISGIIFRKYSRRAYRQVRNKISDLNSFLQENLSGMKLTQLFNQENKQINHFNNKNAELEKTYMKELLIFSIFRPAIYFLGVVGTLLVVYFGLSAFIEGRLTIGRFITYYLLIDYLFGPIQQIAEQFGSLQNGLSSSEKIFDVLDTKPEVRNINNPLPLNTFNRKIEFRDVWFSYLPEEWVLKGVSFTINKGQTLALVGATGSGKTTILQLLVRNYDIQKGEILIDDIPINQYEIKSLKQMIGQMQQEVFLFSGNIKDNIVLHDPNVDEEKLSQAIEYTNLDYVLKNLEDGLMHPVSQDGVNFSQGERQLISFTRALYYKPEIMVLDEATANIDSESEQLIQKSLTKMQEISTMVIVAHRLSTIKNADLIIVLESGKIIEMGNHQQLLNNRQGYYYLYTLQTEKELETERKGELKNA